MFFLSFYFLFHSSPCLQRLIRLGRQKEDGGQGEVQGKMDRRREGQRSFGLHMATVPTPPPPAGTLGMAADGEPSRAWWAGHRRDGSRRPQPCLLHRYLPSASWMPEVVLGHRGRKGPQLTICGEKEGHEQILLYKAFCFVLCCFKKSK